MRQMVFAANHTLIALKQATYLGPAPHNTQTNDFH